MRNGKFFKLVRTYYRFLEDEYAFHLAYMRSEGRILCAYYVNETTGVYIGLDWMETYIIVAFLSYPDMEIEKSHSPIYWHRLENLLRLRCPHLQAQPKCQNPDKEIEERLAMTSSRVRECATDILRGEFEVLEEMAEIQRQLEELSMNSGDD